MVLELVIVTLYSLELLVSLGSLAYCLSHLLDAVGRCLPAKTRLEILD